MNLTRILSAGLVAATAALPLMSASAASATTTGSATKASKSYATNFTFEGASRGGATLRRLSDSRGAYWLGWVSTNHLTAGATYLFAVEHSTANGFERTTVCRFVASTAGKGSCSGRIVLPTSPTSPQAMLFEAGIKDDHLVYDGPLQPSTTAKLVITPDGKARGGHISPAGTSTWRQFTVPHPEKAGMPTDRYWTGSTKVTGLVAGRSYRYSVTLTLPGGTARTIPVCSFTATKDGTGSCWAKVYGASSGQPKGTANLEDRTKTKLTVARGTLTPA